MYVIITDSFQLENGCLFSSSESQNLRSDSIIVVKIVFEILVQSFVHVVFGTFSSGALQFNNVCGIFQHLCCISLVTKNSNRICGFLRNIVEKLQQVSSHAGHFVCFSFWS